jgi:predicted signal transduction protein with EAL and GGDEF domain/DNA-binding response OmpR family regulator
VPDRSLQAQRENPLILLVEDNPVERQLVTRVLRNAGFGVIAVDCGRVVVDAFINNSPDLVLLDGLLPDIDGFDVCRQLRSLFEARYVPIVMLTGLDDEASIDKAYSAGATDFYVKPIVHSILIQRVRYLLRASHAFEDLRVNRESLASAQRVAGLGHWRMSIKTLQLSASPELCRLLGVADTAALQCWADLLSRCYPEDQQRLRDALDMVLADHVEAKIELRVRLREGAERILEMSISPDNSEDDDHDLLIGIGMDITGRKRAEREILRLAFFDRLTQLPNRSFLRNVLDMRIPSVHMSGRSVAMLYIDLDLFSRINNAMGHQVGDHILKQVADRLLRKMQPRPIEAMLDDAMVSFDLMAEKDRSLVVRLDADTFVVVLLDPQSYDVLELANELMALLAVPFNFRGQQLFVTSSIGIALSDSGSMLTDALLQQADLAVHEAKTRGRNQVAEYRRDLVAAVSTRLAIQNDLRKALERNEFVVHYQPKVDTQTGIVCGSEALVRWHHPVRKIISPLDFIPVAEETGLIIDLGLWVLHTACQQHQQWLANGLLQGRVAVNVSARQLREDHFVDQVLQTLSDTGLPPEALEIEITESVLITDSLANLRIRQLRGQGISIALDDFGTGYSALSYLSRYPVDVLKIDRSFITGIPEAADNSAIVEALARLSRRLHLHVVAEGVESQAEYDAATRFGCDVVQGYFVARPMAASDFTAWLSQWQLPQAMG